jgi:protoporphyrin/coproporphyrin ferrochelatase
MLGILLTNIGTPAAPRAREVRRYLRRFLSDQRVVELPRIAWYPILFGIVLPLRGPKSARAYQRIWMQEGSPHAVYTERLRVALARELDTREPGQVRIEAGFLYGGQSIATALERLRSAGADRIIALPLFPQTSGTTTGAAYDEIARCLRAERALPDVRLIPGYAAHPGYIGALVASIQEHWQQQGGRNHLLMSFHGIPIRCVRKGDPYENQCRETAKLVANALALSAAEWTISFQSRFGSERWLEPATYATLALLPAKGTRSVTVCCPGFSVDCLETLEEIAIGGREVFMHAGGERLDYVAALNDRADHARALANLLLA